MIIAFQVNYTGKLRDRFLELGKERGLVRGGYIESMGGGLLECGGRQKKRRSGAVEIWEVIQGSCPKQN